MLKYGIILNIILSLLIVAVRSRSYYSIIAPGVIKSNRKYTVVAALHEADEPALMRISIDGPEDFRESHEIFLRPHEMKKLQFDVFHLEPGWYNLTAEGVSGLQCYEQSRILVQSVDGPKIYIQTDRAIYRPGDMVQFRAVLMDEHTKPLKIREPIRIEVLDGNGNRIKQFKDIALIKGVYSGSFVISKYPAMGLWKIQVILTGKYQYSNSKVIKVEKYILPKFSVYIKTDNDFVPYDRTLKATVYGKYTFDKYVEGNITAIIIEPYQQIELQRKQITINAMADLEFTFDNPTDLLDAFAVLLTVQLREKTTGLIQEQTQQIQIRHQRYSITVDASSIEYRDNKPYRIKAKVSHWNGKPVKNKITPITMKYGSKEYREFLNENGEATYEFEYDENANYLFQFEDSQYKFFNIFVRNDKHLDGNSTEAFCKMQIKGAGPRLGMPLEIEVKSIAPIPYLVYTLVAHSGIVRMEYIKMTGNQNSYMLQINPTIEMIPRAIVYVHYIQNDQMYYNELLLQFPMEFENQISLTAPAVAIPGQEVTLDLKAQRKSYVSILAVDLSVYLLDPSYDLDRGVIFKDLAEDQSYLPFTAIVYPGALSGMLTFTNAKHPFEEIFPRPIARNERPMSIKFRQKFPETWIFKSYEILDENTPITLDLPDTITTWRVTAFSMHEVTGLGMLDGPTDIVAFKTFFIHLNLPYSVKRGELVSIPVTIFNYHNQSLECEIKMFNPEMDFYFVESSSDMLDEHESQDNQKIQNIMVPANGIENVRFVITPKRVGQLSLRITAENSIASDAIMQKLKVEPEGIPKRETKTMYVNAPAGETYSVAMTADIPRDIVSDSEYLSLSVGGDTLVPVLENLNDLVHLPTGCGEQNMVNFVPNILVLDYLKSSHRYAKEKKTVSVAKNYIDIGYQQELSYRHNDGGFSVFGPRADSEPSSWLTAYVIRYFIKAEKYLPIESNIIMTGLEYLKGKQKENGEFEFTGYLIHPAHQNRFGFTAFVLMTFLEKEKYSQSYRTTIDNALGFLKSNMNTVKDIYALAIMAAAFQMANDSSAQIILHKLEQYQRLEPGLKWWSENDVNREKDVEITAYTLLALLGTDNDAQDDMRILRWLLEQRNDLGGFKSTHDTVVGLQALVKFSQKYNDLRNHNLKIQYTAKNNRSETLQRDELHVDSNNALVLQMEELPSATRALAIDITGMGYTLLQLSYRYNIAQNENNFKHFKIETKASQLDESDMQLQVCFSHHQPGVGKTNMIIMEVNFPSGYISRDEDSHELLDNEIIQRIESKNSATTLVIYFENLTANIRNCFDIMADRMHEVMMPKPAAVVIYDYYNISRSDTAFYRLDSSAH